MEEWVKETRGVRVIEVCAQVAAEKIAVEAAKAADEEVRCEPPSILLGSECGEEEEEGEDQVMMRGCLHRCSTVLLRSSS